MPDLYFFKSTKCLDSLFVKSTVIKLFLLILAWKPWNIRLFPCFVFNTLHAPILWIFVHLALFSRCKSKTKIFLFWKTWRIVVFIVFVATFRDTDNSACTFLRGRHDINFSWFPKIFRLRYKPETPLPNQTKPNQTAG